MDNPQPQKQLCQIRIMFAVDSDDEAMAVKKKISESLADKPEINIQFTLGSMPTRPPMG